MLEAIVVGSKIHWYDLLTAFDGACSVQILITPFCGIILLKIKISLLVLLLLLFLNFPSIDRSFECPSLDLSLILDYLCFPSIDRSFECPSLDLSLILDYLCFGRLVHFPSFLQIRESHYDTFPVIVHFKRYLIRLPRMRKQLFVFRPYSLVNKKCTRTLLKFVPIVQIYGDSGGNRVINNTEFR